MASDGAKWSKDEINALTHADAYSDAKLTADSRFQWNDRKSLSPNNAVKMYVHNRPFATNDHMVQNPPCWRASSLLLIIF